MSRMLLKNRFLNFTKHVLSMDGGGVFFVFLIRLSNKAE